MNVKLMDNGNAKPRDYWYDNVKAFLILAVVVGHLANSQFSRSTDWIIAFQKYIYIFHMPVFMMISGRFSKRRVDQADITKVFASILIPYLIAQTLMAVWYTISGYSVGSFSYLKPLFGLWYLMALFFYLWLTPYLKKFRFLFPASVVAAFVAGCALQNVWGGFHRTVAFYPFFLFGYYTADKDFAVFKKWWFRLLSVIVFFAVAVFVISNAKKISFNLLELNTSFWTIKEDMGLRLREVLGQAVLRYAVAFLYFGVIMGITPCRKVFYSYVGTNSVYVYALHLFVIVWLKGIDKEFDILDFLTRNAQQSVLRLVIYLCMGVVLGFILASKPVRKVFKFMLEPDISLDKWKGLFSGKNSS